jgi:excinuclease ABC subunit C
MTVAGSLRYIRPRLASTLAADVDHLDRHIDQQICLDCPGERACRTVETAARWREKFESLEWLLAASVRARAAVDLLTFVYRDPGSQGDDRIYLIRRGTVRATFPNPTTPIELEAFRAAVAEESARAEAPGGVLPVERLDEVMVVMAWFRKHPDAFRRTTPIESWNAVTN